MTLQEVKALVAGAKNKKWFEEMESTGDETLDRKLPPFVGYAAFYEFIEKQVNGWASITEELPPLLLAEQNLYSSMLTSMQKLLVDNVDNGFLTIAASRRRAFDALPKSTTYRYVAFDSPEALFLIELHQSHPSAVVSATAFLENDLRSDTIKDSAALTGVLLAYEFKYQADSYMPTRRRAEQVSIERLRKEFAAQIKEAKTAQAQLFSDSTKEIYDVKAKLESLKKAQEKNYDTFHKQRTATSDEDLHTAAKNHAELYSKSQGEIATLQTTYEELLRLKKPAEYWDARATKLKKEGRSFLNWLIALVTLGTGLLFTLLWITPEDMLQSFFNDDKSAAIRWSIVFITMMSFLIFGIRALTKVTFSSYHLARDAEERKELTYLYLSMVNENVFDEKDRHLVMQSLFSRADSGLLRDDGGPTMPKDMVSNVTSK